MPTQWQAAIRTLSKLVPQVPAPPLLEALPSMLPGLFEAFRHTNADVRKAVVFALVDMYMVLGPRFEVTNCFATLRQLLPRPAPPRRNGYRAGDDG